MIHYNTSEQLAWLIRRHGIEMTHLSGGSHVGAIMSVADIVAVLYADVMKFRVDDPKWDGRDRFILSKGHGAIALYAALKSIGVFTEEELLKTAIKIVSVCLMPLPEDQVTRVWRTKRFQL